MSGEFIAVWERIWFEKGEPTKWERSMDKGKTWETIHWPFGQLPFILCNPSDELAYVIHVKREEA